MSNHRSLPSKLPLKLVAMLSVVAICMGACAGALARWRLGLWLSAPTAALPWGTLAANLVGGYLAGVGMGLFAAAPQFDPAWRLAVMTGFLGALTTFSGFSTETVALLQQQRYLLAAGNAGLHLFGTLALTAAGLRSASFLIAVRA